MLWDCLAKIPARLRGLIMSRKYQDDWNRLLSVTNYRDFILFAEEHHLVTCNAQTRLVSREPSPLNDRLDELVRRKAIVKMEEYGRFLENQTKMVFSRLGRVVDRGEKIRGTVYEQLFDDYFKMAVDQVESFIDEVPCCFVILLAIGVLVDFVNIATSELRLDPYFMLKVNPKLLARLDAVPEPKEPGIFTDRDDESKVPVIVSGSKVGISLGEKQLFIRISNDNCVVKSENLQRLFLLWRTEDVHLIEDEIVETEAFRKKIEDANQTGDLIEVAAHLKEQHIGSRWGDEHKTILIWQYKRHSPQRAA